jgi:DnaJ-domain-containing protein 1
MPGTRAATAKVDMDYFAILDQPRLPWLDPDALKTRFLALGAETHPDRAPSADKESATRRYAELNAAYNCLREPKDRLAHLIELETGRGPVDTQENPASLVDLFFALAHVFQNVDKFLKQRSWASSPLAKAQSFADGLEWTDKLMQFQSQINARRQQLETQLRALNDATQIAQLTALYREFSFLKRWSEQTQERIARLATE